MMDFGRVNTRQIYVVQFNPVESNEFNNQHLAIVLKKNNDKKTCIVMPLTSEPNGEGTNKINIGKVATLPSNLKNTNSYAVYNQVRTVNVNRFKPLMENNAFINCTIEDKLFLELLDLGTSQLLYDLDFDEKIALYKGQYEKANLAKIVDLAYTILKLTKEVNLLIKDNSKIELRNSKILEVESIKIKIRDILQMRIEYTLTERQIKDGLDNILNNILK